MKTIIKLFVVACLVLKYIDAGSVIEKSHDVTASESIAASKPKPLRGIYRNYKSTFLGNRTVSEYTKQLKTPKIKQRKKSKNSKKNTKENVMDNRYELGQGVNITLDMEKDIVNVNLDANNLKDVILGFWGEGDSGEGKVLILDFILFAWNVIFASENQKIFCRSSSVVADDSD